VISRRHALIYRREGRWYIKDLGSRNKTAVYRDKKWHLVYRGYMSESQPFELKNGDVVAICYDEQYGPYIQITIKIPSSGA
ncbi:MAG: FHA domain-containing protein, partial [Pyrobaculum sp.]